MNSRTAAMIPATYLLLYYTRKGRNRNIVLLALLTLTLYALVSALVGRSNPIQGFSGLYDTMLDVIDGGIFPAVARLILTVGEGIYVVAEGFKLLPHYDDQYALLSFSPLPSLFDGFSEILEGSQVRLHEFVPVSSLTELLGFGYIYLILYFVILIFLIRLHLKIERRNPTIYLAVNFIILLSMYTMLAYPVRNSLRSVWIGFYILGAYLLVASWLARRPSEPEKVRSEQLDSERV